MYLFHLICFSQVGFVLASSSTPSTITATASNANVTSSTLSANGTTSPSTVLTTTGTTTTPTTTPTTPLTTQKPDPGQLKIHQCNCKTGFCNITKQDNILGVMFYSQTNESYYFSNFMVVYAPTSVQTLLISTLADKKLVCTNIDIPEDPSGIYNLPLQGSCAVQSPGNFYYLKPNTSRVAVNEVKLPCPVNTNITLQPIDISSKLTSMCGGSQQEQRTVVLNIPTTVSFPQQTTYFIVAALCIFFLFLIISCRPLKIKRQKDYY